MKKNIYEILMTVTPNTPFEDIVTYCDSVDDFNLILSRLPYTESKPITLSAEIKESAIRLILENKIDASSITTSFIQRNLPVTYPQSAALVDWLNSALVLRKL